MIDSILAVIVLIIAGWAIAKNYDAKVVLFIAALVLLYSGLLLGHNVLGAKATTGLSWVDPFKVIWYASIKADISLITQLRRIKRRF